MSMETLIEDYKLKDPTGSIDGTGTYFRNNGEDIEMTCFSSAVPSGKQYYFAHTASNPL